MFFCVISPRSLLTIQQIIYRCMWHKQIVCLIQALGSVRILIWYVDSMATSVSLWATLSVTHCLMGTILPNGPLRAHLFEKKTNILRRLFVCEVPLQIAETICSSFREWPKGYWRHPISMQLCCNNKKKVRLWGKPSAQSVGGDKPICSMWENNIKSVREAGLSQQQASPSGYINLEVENFPKRWHNDNKN